MLSKPSFLLLTLALTTLGGSLLPVQFATNSALAQALGSVTLAGAVSYGVGSAALFALLRLQRHAPAWANAGQAPRWAWLGGVVGSAYVVGSMVLTRALGAPLATTLVITAQLLTAILLDHHGALGLPRRRINRARLLAITLALMALAVRWWGTT
ncbi:DMT family transporter [Deinococcus sonorensis]|uniref:DMT family transporter n=2 Tax=Deinococcus sonorensis TaxID=309891 RepID=A0AAU7U6Z8_9DEIO